MAWHGMAWHGAPVSWHGMAWHRMAWHGMAWHRMAWHGMARHGMAWHGMACGTAHRYLVDTFIRVQGTSPSHNEGWQHPMASLTASTQEACTCVVGARGYGGPRGASWRPTWGDWRRRRRGVRANLALKAALTKAVVFGGLQDGARGRGVERDDIVTRLEGSAIIASVVKAACRGRWARGDSSDGAQPGQDGHAPHGARDRRRPPVAVAR